jgi:hypothetical protein
MDRGTFADRETLERIKKALMHKHNADMISVNNVVVHYPDGAPSEVKFNANAANEVKRTGKQYNKEDIRDTFNFNHMKTMTSSQMLENSVNKSMPALGWDRPATQRSFQPLIESTNEGDSAA